MPVKGITPEMLIEIKHQARLELIRRYAEDKNILEWGKVLFPDKFTLPFCKPLHEYLVFIRNEPFTNTEAPRNYAKTLIKCFLVPLFQALNDPETYRHYLNVQSTSTKATTVNLAIRVELENNELLKEIYGDLVNLEKWTEKQFVLKQNKNGKKYETIFTAIGSNESIRGLNYHNVRPDYIIVDDLYDESDINNLEQTTKKTDWFWSSLYLARAKSNRCSLQIQGTAINQHDLLEQLKADKGVKSKNFNAIIDEGSKTVLWPELETYEKLMIDKERMGSVKFARELMNERRDSESSIIKEHWLQWYNGPKQGEHDDIGISADEIVIKKMCGCDPSIGEKEKNDFTGIATVIKTKLKEHDSFRFYIKSVINEHLSLDKRIKRLDNLHKIEKFNTAYIEAISGFKDFADEVVRTTNLPVTKVVHVPDKIANLENKSHWFENGKVFINRNMDSKMKTLIIEQLINNYPSHDDIRDAILLTLDASKIKGHGSVTASKGL